MDEKKKFFIARFSLFHEKAGKKCFETPIIYIIRFTNVCIASYRTLANGHSLTISLNSVVKSTSTRVIVAWKRWTKSVRLTLHGVYVCVLFSLGSLVSCRWHNVLVERISGIYVRCIVRTHTCMSSWSF